MFVRFESSVAGGGPVGPAGGDLSGFYPDPNVRGFHETTGPTQLLYGSVPDLTYLKRSGLTVVGTDPNVDVKGPWSNAIYVDGVRGSDVTGTRGNDNRPFATIQAAVNIATTNDVVYIAPLRFATTTAITIPATVVRVSFVGVARGAPVNLTNPGLTQVVCTGDHAFDLGANLGLLECYFVNMTISAFTAGKSGIFADGSLYASFTFLTAGLGIENCALGGSSGNAISLKYVGTANLNGVVAGLSAFSFVNCLTLNLFNVNAKNSAFTLSSDLTDPLTPQAQGNCFVRGGCILGGGTAAFIVTLGGQAQISVDSSSTIGGLKGATLSVHAGPTGVPAVACCGSIGGGNSGVLDFATAGAELPDTASALSFDFRGARLMGPNPAAVIGVSTAQFKVAGGAPANFQTVKLDSSVALPGCTFTADSKIHMTCRGAVQPSAVYTTPGSTTADGDIIPPTLGGTVDVSAGGTVAKTWVQLGYAGFIRAGAAPDFALLTESAAASDTFISARTTTGLTIGAAVVGGDTACNWMAVWK